MYAYYGTITNSSVYSDSLINVFENKHSKELGFHFLNARTSFVLQLSLKETLVDKTRTGAVGGNVVIQDGDKCGEIRFSGADGTDISNNAASIIGAIDGTPRSIVSQILVARVPRVAAARHEGGASAIIVFSTCHCL